MEIRFLYCMGMSNTYKMIRLVGTSEKGFEDAIQNAVSEAGHTLKGLNWFEVVEHHGKINEAGKVVEWQVVMDVAFKIIKH